MPNTPDTQTLPAVNVTSLLTKYPKQITEREFFTLGKLAGTNAATVTFTGLGKHPKTGINPVESAVGVVGAYALLTLSGIGDGGVVCVCTDGTAYARTKAGVKSHVHFAANGAEPAVATVMGKDTDVNGLQVGTVVEGSAFTNTWTVTATRVDVDEITLVLKHTTPATDQQWNATIDVAGIVDHAVHVTVGSPAAIGTPNSDVLGAVAGAFVTAQSITLDTTAPTITAFTIPGTDTDYTITISSFTATDASGNGSVSFAVTAENVQPAADSDVWSAEGTPPSTFTIPTALRTGSGVYTLYGWAKDASGNVTATATTDTVTLTIA